MHGSHYAADRIGCQLTTRYIGARQVTSHVRPAASRIHGVLVQKCSERWSRHSASTDYDTHISSLIDPRHDAEVLHIARDEHRTALQRMGGDQQIHVPQRCATPFEDGPNPRVVAARVATPIENIESREKFLHKPDQAGPAGFLSAKPQLGGSHDRADHVAARVGVEHVTH